MKFNRFVIFTLSVCVFLSLISCGKKKTFVAPIYEEPVEQFVDLEDLKNSLNKTEDAMAKTDKNKDKDSKQTKNTKQTKETKQVNPSEKKVKDVFAYMEKEAIKFYNPELTSDVITEEILKQANADYEAAQARYKAIAEKSYDPNDKKAAAEQLQIRKAIKIRNFAKFKEEVVSQELDYNQFVADLENVLAIDAEVMKKTGDYTLLYLCDKDRNIDPIDYAPKSITKLVQNNDYVINKNNLSLRSDVAEQLTVLAQAAKKDGVTLDVSSSYRSYETQKNTFNYWVSVDGLYEAERESARPGTSQHQMGVALDFGSISNEYASTKGGKWMYANAANYGWSLSFPSKEYEEVTGFKWESWHFRYIGKEACALQKKYFNDIQQYMIEFVDAWRTVYKTTDSEPAAEIKE